MKSNAKRGGKRKGAGRKTMFEGKRVPLAVKVTEDCARIVEENRVALEAEHGSAATQGSSVEYLIRKATGKLKKAKRSRG